MERATPPFGASVLDEKRQPPEDVSPEHPEDDLSFRSFNGYMFRATMETLPLITLLVAAAAVVTLVDLGLITKARLFTEILNDSIMRFQGMSFYLRSVRFDFVIAVIVMVAIVVLFAVYMKSGEMSLEKHHGGKSPE